MDGMTPLHYQEADAASDFAEIPEETPNHGYSPRLAAIFSALAVGAVVGGTLVRRDAAAREQALIEEYHGKSSKYGGAWGEVRRGSVGGQTTQRRRERRKRSIPTCVPNALHPCQQTHPTSLPST